MEEVSRRHRRTVLRPILRSSRPKGVAQCKIGFAGLAGGFMPDDAHNLALLDFEADILERPNSSPREPGTPGAPSGRKRFARKIMDFVSDHISQCRITFIISVNSSHPRSFSAAPCHKT